MAVGGEAGLSGEAVERHARKRRTEVALDVGLVVDLAQVGVADAALRALRVAVAVLPVGVGESVDASGHRTVEVAAEEPREQPHLRVTRSVRRELAAPLRTR